MSTFFLLGVKYDQINLLYEFFKREKSHSQTCDKVFQLESQNEITNAKKNHKQITFLSCKILRYNHEFQLHGNIV